MERKGRVALAIILTFILTAAACVGALLLYLKFTDQTITDADSVILPESSKKQYEKFMDIQGLIENKYLYDYDEDEEWEAVYRSMISSLGDKYSRFLDEEELKAQQQTVNSSFVGTGIVFKANGEGALIVRELVSGSPAFNSGIQVGDQILAVDGKEVTGEEETTAALKGDAGTSVTITIKRGEETGDFSLVRGMISNASVEMTTLEGNIGYIRIKSFGEETFGLFDAALSGFESAGAKGIVLDLRGNPGGVFDVGIRIADRILPECLITHTEDKGGETETFNSDSKGTPLPMVVLVNRGTASTGELLAAALRDNGAAKLVGEQTYGKGVVQETRVYTDGTAVNITVKEYFTPKGERIEGVGLAPDVVVENMDTTTEDEQLTKAMEQFNAV